VDFLKKLIKNVCFYNLTNLFSFILLHFQTLVFEYLEAEKTHLLNQSSLFLSLSLPREKEEDQEEKSGLGWGLNPGHSGDRQAPYPLPHEDISISDASASCLDAKQRPGSYPWEIAMSLIYGPLAECNTPLHS
jgi:hypothetical protein